MPYFERTQVQLPWWQIQCLDVYLAIAAAVLLAAAVVWKVMSLLLRSGKKHPYKRVKMD